LNPGFAFGGSCLPKDLRALTYRAKELDLHLPLMESILPSNNEHVQRAADAILGLSKRKIGILGLSFKTGTDDLRESPMVHLVKMLIAEGCDLQIWDESVALGQLIGSNREFIQTYIPHIGSLMKDNVDAVLSEAEVVVLGTTAVSPSEIKGQLRRNQHLVDVINLEQSMGKADIPVTRIANASHAIE
jgi:GDP-mannose 6-dehydrogenase